MTFAHHIEVKKGFLCFGQIKTASLHKISYINSKHFLGKAILKIIGLFARLFPSLSRVQFDPNDYVLKDGYHTLEAAFSINKNQLKHLITSRCHNSFSTRQAPGSFVNKVVQKFSDPKQAPTKLKNLVKQVEIEIERDYKAHVQSQQVGKLQAPAAAKITSLQNADTSEILKHTKSARETLKSGTDANTLLMKAIKQERPETAAWLLQNGASLKGDEEGWVKHLTTELKPTPENLHYFAVERGYGHKAANLMVLQAYAQQLNATLKSCQVAVPPFLPVSNFEITAYLKCHYDLKQDWKTFLNTFDQEAVRKFPANSKSSITIHEDGVQILASIRQKIRDVFRDTPYFSIQIEEWIKKHPDYGFIIARSTGLEDTKELTNAGGNRSIPFIERDAHKISIAMGEVLASYFSEKSLNQRLKAKDKNFFTNKPFLPVLLQFMVVEEAGTDGFKAEDIPRSGVILTSETGKAASVTVVQATHGLCEGVVESRVPTDTFYIGTSGRPYPVIRKKTTRIVHQPTDNESYETVLQDNPLPVLQLGWSIPKKLFPGIKLLSNKVHELYGESIDIEFTAKLRTKKSAKPTIFLTQARPEMVTNASQEKKTFLDLANVKAIPNRGFVATQTLLGCGEFVRTVSHPDHIIIADDLDQAVQLHNKDDENKTKLIISKRGTIGSHFATILKNRGIPVFITHDPHIHHQVKCLVNKVESQHPLLACSQRGMLVALKKTLDKHKMIRKGFCTYPIPLERSLQPHSMTNLKPTTPEVVAVLHVAHLNGRYRRLLERTINNLPPTDKSPRELIETMALGETWEAKQALGYLVKMLFCCFTKELRETHPQGRSNLKNFLRVMETILEEAEKELLPALTEYAPQTAERLFYIRQLEALAFQAYQNSIVQGYSFYTEMTLMHQINILKGAVRNKKALYDPLALPLFLAHKKAFKDGCAKNWRTFIEELRNSKDGSLALHSCARLVNDMQRINLLPYWLNIIFTQAWKENRKKRNRADIILKRLNKVHENNKETLDWVKQKWKLLKEKDSQVSLWRYPAFVKENLGDFHNNFVEDIELTQKKGRPSLISRYSQTDILGRLALLELLDRAVDIIDRTIKSTKGSTDYDDPVQQAKDYARMIPSFFQILQSTLKLISKEDENKLMKPNHGLRVSFDEYLDKLQNGGEYQYDWQRRYSKGYQVLCKEVKDEKGNVLLQMEPRQKFNVAPLVPGSKADLDHSVFWPERLEEYVMLFHQATIKMTQHERKKCGLNLKIVPPELKQICQIIENKFDTEISNIWNDNATLHVIYNIPVRQHSARLDVLYKLDSPTEGVQLHVDCFGVNEFRRWDRTAAFAAYLAHNKITSFVDGTSPKINYDLAVGVSFGFNLKKSLNQTTKLITIVHYIIKTFNQLEVDSCSDLISKLKEQTNPFNWNSVDEEFFQDSLYLNAFLMQKFAQKNEEISLLLKAAKNSLIGLSRYKIDDYFHHEEIETLKGYLRDPKYSFIPDNHDSNKDSLKLIAILYLAKAFKENPKEATPAILSLIGNADLIRQHSSIVKALKQLLHIEKKPLDSFKAFWSQKEYALGMELAHKVNDAEMTKQVDVFIEEKTASFEGKKLLTDLASKLYDDGLFEVVDSKIKSHLSSKQCEDLAHRKRRQMRKLHLKNLKSYATDLHDCALQFDKKYRTLVTKSVDSIIGLSQAADFYKDFGVYFKGFEKYLKVSRYGYIPENNSKNTNWLWMAAALNLVKGIESPDEIREETLDALARLITDYREFGQFSEHAYIIKGILDALYKCLENNKLLNNDQVKQKLEKAWGDYTKIPTSPQKKIVLSPE